MAGDASDDLRGKREAGTDESGRLLSHRLELGHQGATATIVVAETLTG